MAREKHPDFHAKEIRDLLQRSLLEEILVPFESKERAGGLRALLYSLIRAHRLHETPEVEQLRHFRSRIYLTYDVINQRDKYEPNYVRYPFTLLIDSRKPFEKNLGLATSGEEISLYHEPKKPKQPEQPEQPTASEDAEIELTYDFDESEEEQGDQLADLLSSLNKDDTS
jgi:hypothetical protein